jgi:peptidoglycan-N-acetylglucosamine deacetylase
MKRPATIQVDLDGLWTNLEYYGNSHSIKEDSVYHSSIPRFLEMFDKYNIKATFFVIGKDLEIPWKAKLIKQISKAGHEIANHTYSHPFGFRKLPSEQKQQEIDKCAKLIEKVIGKKSVGFKSPGYDVDVETLKILAANNYIYDSSMIPTFAYPLLMKLNRLMAGGVKRTHGPKWSWGFAPNKIYYPSSHSEWKRGNLNLLELPCTVMPFFRIPFHATFVNKLGMKYFNLAYNLCWMLDVPFNYEFHAVDLANDDKRLVHVGLGLDKRIRSFDKVLQKISSGYNCLSSNEFLKKVKRKNGN